MSPLQRIQNAALWYAQNRDRFPAQPFQLSQEITVTNPAKFYASLDRAIAEWDGTASRLAVCYILLPIKKLRRYLEVSHADAA